MHAFVALDGGGALLVTADPNTPAQAWFISPNASPALVATLGVVTDVKLFTRAPPDSSTSGGGAVLWTGSAWLAFDPWSGTFSAIAASPSQGPDAASPIASADPGLRAWVSTDGSVSLWRDSVRNAFATDDVFLSAQTGTSLVAPDTIPGPAFDTQQGIALGAGQTVFVSDARYLDVDVDVTVSGASLPLVVLRSSTGEIEVGGQSCPYPASASVSAVHVLRTGPLVQVAAGGAFSTCATMDPSTRVAVGVRGGTSGSRAKDLHVTRLAR